MFPVTLVTGRRDGEVPMSILVRPCASERQPESADDERRRLYRTNRTGMRLAARTMAGAHITEAKAARMSLRRVIPAGSRKDFG
jgi:hypothetical protein